MSRGQPGGVKAELTGGKWSLGGGDLIAGASTGNARRINANYAREISAATASGGVVRGIRGEDDADVEEARLPVKCARWRWGLSVSD